MQETGWAAARPPISPSTQRPGAVFHRSIPGYRLDRAVLLLIAAALSLAALLWYLHQGQLLLWGDAVAHTTIARRVFDSRDPRLLQLGTVWLPLPHLLILPFVISNRMWSSGVGGAIPSMIAYVLAALGVFRLVRTSLGADREARLAAWFAAAIFLLNPNVLYMQSVAMGEVLCVASSVWATAMLADFVAITWREESMDAAAAARSLTACAILLGCDMYTRYDGWFAAAVFSLVAIAVWWRRARRTSGDDRRILTRALLRYVLLLAAVAGLWFAYNYALSGRPLDFFDGPYSAKAIEQRTSRGFVHPGDHDLKVAGIYFVKSTKLTVADGGWQNPFWYAALLGIAALLALARRSWALLLLWFPWPFYALSVAYGSIPIFLPDWWPFTYYNDRYGIELLPAIAVFTAVLAYAAALLLGRRQYVAWLAAAVLVAGSYTAVWRNQPICLREAIANSRTRIALERELAVALSSLPPQSTFLMDLGAHSGALQSAGIPLRRTINETIRVAWPRALASPAASADYVVAFDGDPVAQAVAAHPAGLQPLATIAVPGQAAARLYRCETSRTR